MSDISSILQDLAAGRIDATEAARRIEVAQRPAPQQPIAPTADATGDAHAAGSSTHEAPAGHEAPSSHAEGQHDAPRHEEERRGEDLLDDAKHFAAQARSRLRKAWAAVSEDEKSEAGEQSAADAPESPSSPRTPTRASRQQQGAGERPRGSRGVERVVIRAVGRRVRLLGDPSVATVAVDGPHVLRRTGSAIEISSEGELGPSLKGFSLIRPPRSRDDLRTVGLGKELVVKVNPAIVADVEVTAGGLRVDGVPVLGKIRVTTGGARLNGVTEVADALIQAGNARVHGPISQGRSRIRVESGGLHVGLAEGSNVTVKGEAQLGKVSWPVEGKAQMDELVVGNGSAKLDLAVTLGRITVELDEDHQG